jgi:undecaprenyl pyrophosphate phosphatase UppP
MPALLITLAVLAVVGAIPALYLGALLLAATGSALLFPLPVLVCLLVAGACLHAYERTLS